MVETNWKTEPLVWMLILIPLSAVVMGIVMITLAIKSETGLVVDDYYKKGKEINRVLARDERAVFLALGAKMSLDRSQHRLRVSIESKSGTTLADKLTVNFFHSTRPGKDQTIQLHRTTNNVYQGTFDPFSPGRWNVQLETSTWRLLGSLQVPGDATLRLSSGL